MPTPRDVRTPARAFLDFFVCVEPSVTLATSTLDSIGCKGSIASGIKTGSVPVVLVPGSVPGSVVPPSPEGGVVGDVTRFLTER